MGNSGSENSRTGYSRVTGRRIMVGSGSRWKPRNSSRSSAADGRASGSLAMPRRSSAVKLRRHVGNVGHRLGEHVDQRHQGRVVVLPPARRSAAHQGIQRGAEPVDVGGRHRPAVVEHLGRRVGRRELQGDRRLAGLGQHGETEVGQRRLAERVMRMLAGLTSRCRTPSAWASASASAILAPTSRASPAGERVGPHPVGVRPGTEFHDHVWVAVVGDPDIDQVDHVRMARHPAGGAGLADEPPLVLVALQRPVLDLDRHLAVDRGLGRPVDGRVAAVREHGQPARPGTTGVAAAASSGRNRHGARYATRQPTGARDAGQSGVGGRRRSLTCWVA